MITPAESPNLQAHKALGILEAIESEWRAARGARRAYDVLVEALANITVRLSETETQRDGLLAERDGLLAERDAAKAEREQLALALARIHGSAWWRLLKVLRRVATGSPR